MDKYINSLLILSFSFCIYNPLLLFQFEDFIEKKLFCQWSYGIVTWEILTRGAIPYPTVETRDILLYLNAGNRMERPDCCPYKL